MWRFEKKQLNENVIQYKIKINDEFISNKQFIHHLEYDLEFRKFYNSILSEAPFEAYFWENKPMNNANLNETYEFVLVNSPGMIGLSPEIAAFKSYFREGELAVHFPNLGGDAHLIVPCLETVPQHYTHIANFVRNAPLKQIDALWKLVGIQLRLNIGEQPKWLSTAGFGIYWMHARIDSKPKYYRYNPYRIYR